MNKPPLVVRTMLVTNTEENLAQLQHETDIEFYEAKIAAVQAESDARLELIKRLMATIRKLNGGSGED